MKDAGAPLAHFRMNFPVGGICASTGGIHSHTRLPGSEGSQMLPPTQPTHNKQDKLCGTGLGLRRSALMRWFGVRV